jgi:hypothetical protein
VQRAQGAKAEILAPLKQEIGMGLSKDSAGCSVSRHQVRQFFRADHHRYSFRHILHSVLRQALHTAASFSLHPNEEKIAVLVKKAPN